MNNSFVRYKMGELCRIKHGYPFKGEYFSDEGKYIILTPGNFYEQGGFKRIVGKEKFYLGDVSEEYICKKGDLIVAMTEQAEGLLGSTALVPEDDLYLHNQRIGLVFPENGLVDKIYLYYLFMTKNVRKQLRGSSSGTKVKHTSPEKIYDVEVWIPNIKDQRSITRLLYSIDKKIDIINKINDNLQQQAKILYDYWFIQFDFPDENGNPYRSSGGAMLWNEELKREIPYSWKCVPLSNILLKNTRSFDYKSTQPTIDLSVMPSSSISLTQLNSSDAITTNLFEMKEGDILFGSIRPYLKKAGIAPCDGVVAGTVHSYSTIKENDYNFALCTISRDSFFDYALQVSCGTRMPVISSDNLLSYKVAYSEDIVTKFNALPLKHVICRNVQEMQELTILRDWLLPTLMNGQVTVTD